MLPTLIGSGLALRAASLLLRNPAAGEPAGEEETLPEDGVLVYPAALKLAAEADHARP